ncbi:MAG: hypothetical protein ACT4OM_00250 [Actinomycetota bacterium]
MDVTKMMERMDQLLQKHAPQELERPGNIMTAAIIAAEDAVKEGHVSGALWDESGSQMLAAHYAYFRGIPIGTFTAPFIGMRFREIQRENGENPLAPPCQL